MALRPMREFRATQLMQDAVVDRHGIPVVIWRPIDKQKMVGYEMDPTLYTQDYTKCYINFSPKRRVFYHFNWFPEGEAQVIGMFFFLSTPVEADMLIRTVPEESGAESAMPSGDLLFRISKVFDEGKYKVLKRTCFGVIVPDKTMLDRFTPAVPL
jgi:hypothetical protein